MMLLAKSMRRHMDASLLDDITDENIEDYRNIDSEEVLNDSSPDDWRAIRKLTDRSWFQRACVVQEVCSRPNKIVRLGESCLPWIALSSLFV